MKVAISAIRTNKNKLNRHELIKSIQELGHEVFYIGQGEEENPHDDYKKYKVSFISVPITRNNTNPFKEILSIYKTSKILKTNKIEVLIIYGIRTFPIMVTAAKLSGVKNILCIVNGSGRLFQLEGIKGKIIKSISYPMLMLSFFQANNILFQNIDDLEMIKSKKMLIKNNYSVINGSGVNLKEFPYTSLETKPVFTMISRLTVNKGVNEFINAAIEVKKRYDDSIFNLIGPIDNKSGIDEEKLEYVKKHDIIKVKGGVNDVRPHIKESRVFVLPSYSEGVPRSVLEAMSMGRAIITTDTPGCRETVVNGINGFLIKPYDAKDLEEKMIWMINNKKSVDKMGVKSREIAIKKFDVNAVNKIIVNKANL